ncbi:cytochrome c biogenesis protein ResB [Methylobacter luteus]|uniref:cytochrome c biogenesis protein ResB n=1 Tax=Methylobacter luteus TaxID=415 RepID=UPI000403382E|nr:cytochrome c biogenesis protein ResB [Methylobacter luteus]
MNLAITLLVAVAIAAVIGTVLKQNQPYADYVLKFGPFWFEIFKTLDLYDVYSSSWFLTILTFLVISTSVCVYRNTPHMLRDMRNFHEHAHQSALQRLAHHAQWQSGQPLKHSIDYVSALLRHKRYKIKQLDTKGGLLIAAKKGAGSRLGYIFTHVAIIIICIGGLLDGNVPLKIAQMRGDIAVETRRIPASEVPEKSALPADNLSFRANIDITEGKAANIAFIDFKDGYLVQKLPFTIRVDDFRIEHYESGQPKSFESDLTIIDKNLSAPIRQTISVNHPFSYKGYTIYQNSFGDGGSLLKLALHPLTGADSKAQEIEAAVKEAHPIRTAAGELSLEIADFRPFNVNPDPTGVKKFRNIGPSFQFKLRKANGVAYEYLNYMQPVEQDGAYFYLSGMRRSPAEPFQYWFIPAGADKRPDRFLNFLAALNNPGRLNQVATATAQSTENSKNLPAAEQQKVAEFMIALSRQFTEGGNERISAQIEKSVPEAQRKQVAELYATVLHQFLINVYLSVLEQEGMDATQPVSDFDMRFFENAVNALSVAYQYGSPVLVTLNSFKHIEATGLQLTRSPGQWLVFPGCLLLAVGVFFMFYLPQRRLWVIIKPEGEKSSLTLAGSALRNRYDFDREFELIRQDLTQKLT